MAQRRNACFGTSTTNGVLSLRGVSVEAGKFFLPCCFVQALSPSLPLSFSLFIRFALAVGSAAGDLVPPSLNR